ncbi:citrate synthase [Kineosphaera limosa]|uniref:Citrate synthase n=1 Tax=Kineosphaera limosa NBRC 100340 TaxID=1184609 RepID=K6W9Z0_9MICO|nr:citrate synthase [Kineosphaera limosa]NYE02455.1 citrate synthase [Kineosphaera limosa]GAB96020.1 citrate synthase [Kineosphaera limosa NBRC 100340]
MANEAQLTIGEKQVTLPIVESTEGNNGVDVSSLLKDTGDTTFDVGFANTAACRSAITYIDGDEGILRYRGYPIEQLAEKSTFLEVAYLVLYGELPTRDQADEFEDRIKRSSLLDERMRDLFRCFPRRSHPMPVLSAGIMALSTFNSDSTSVSDPDQIETATINLLGKAPTFAAYGYKNSMGQPMLYPKNDLSYIENFMRLSFGLPTEMYEPDPKVTRALDTLFILHADHEQNCSTSTVRLVGSSQADIYTSVASGVNALSGPRHGGANQQVLEMLQRIQADGGDADKFVERIKNREEGARLMGFGHRVYKNYDPRAAIVKQHADQILSESEHHDALLDIALRLEEIALSDDFFKERRLYPNVDFYTGLLYQAIGFPTNMFTVLFALGRLPGWIAHWREQNADPASKIGRPRQIYIGETERDFVDIDKR